MTGYKVFQCAATDYILEPARYEKITFTKSVARYELMMECNWVSSMQAVCNAMTGDVISSEDMRQQLFADHYKASGGATDGAASPRAINVQWADLIATLLQQTSWANVDGTSRVVDQTLVDAEMGQTPNVQNGAKTGFVAGTAAAGTLQLGSAGLAAVLATDPLYDAESLGDLINQSNMYDILEKLIRHGCFIKVHEEGVASPKLTVNPLTQKDTSGSNTNDASPEDELLLDNGDEMVFPIDVKHIVGHSGDDPNEDVGAVGASFEVQIVFKLSGQSDDKAGHTNLAAGDLVTGSAAAQAIPDGGNLVQ